MSDPRPSSTDVLIVGAGIAGASLAAALAPHRRVLMVEAEEAPGYHATGRSAAFWHESYGGPGVQPLSAASFEALARPAPDFSDKPFLTPRTALTIGRGGAETAAVDAFVAEFRAKGVVIDRMGFDAMAALVPGLRSEWTAAAYEAACSDIDVGALHAAYLRAAKRGGAVLATRARFDGARRVTGGWEVSVGGETLRAELIVDAAGAWADMVAARCGIAPVGIQPYRRTVAQQFDIGRQVASHGLMPILEPEVTISIADKAEAEAILQEEILKALEGVEGQVMLKLSLPTVPDFYQPLVKHPKVLKVVALSGGHSREAANQILAQNHGIIASFSRALSEGLSAKQSEAEFNKVLKNAVDSIHAASIT